MNEELLQTPAIPDAAYDYGDEYAFGSEVEFEIKDVTNHNQARSCQMNHPETKYACTIIGAVNQLIKLYDLNLSPTDADKLGLEVATYATKFGYKFGSGWSTPTAINVVTKWRNEFGAKRYNKEQVFYVRLDSKDPKIMEALNKGHYVGFTYQLKFGEDTYRGLVDKESYPIGYGHRTNFQRKEDVDTASKRVYTDVQLGVHDNYHGRVNEYYIKDIQKYVGRGMFPAMYLIMPISRKKGATVEEEKKQIKEHKAVNALIGMLSCSRAALDEKGQSLASELASHLRKTFEGARALQEDETKKYYQAVADVLSFAWKNADESFQQKYAQLAKEIRDTKTVL